MKILHTNSSILIFFLKKNKKISTFILHLTDVRINGGSIEYLIQQRDNIPPVVVPSVQAFKKWPCLIFEYLEECLFFARSTTNSNQTTITESGNVVGQPINISCKFFFSYFSFFLNQVHGKPTKRSKNYLN